MRATILCCLLAVACLLGAGCASTRPVHYYTIDLPGTPRAEPKADGRTLLVGNIVTPESLQDGRIRYRTGAHEAGAYEYHRWTERPGTLVRELLVRDLRGSGNYRRVLEASSTATGDYLIRGKLGEFDELDRADIQTRIALHIELIDMKTNRNVWDRQVERTEPVDGKAVKDVVASLDRNLQHVIADVTGGIGQFLATQH